MYKYIAGIALCLITFSCDDEPDDPFCDHYEKGKILIGIEDNVNIEQSFDLVNGYGFHVDAVFGHYYESSLHSDSITYIVDYLNSKNYINTNGFKAVEGASVYLHSQTGVLTVFCNLWDMTIENQEDWIETMSILKFTEQLGARAFVLTVPTGEEKEWVTTFKNLDNIRSADLNCYFNISD
jgi:hypothetical protein